MELVIAEKPSVAQSIAAVLGATQRKDGYLEGNEYLVSWCVGHLVELVQPESYEEAWKKWSYDNLPIIPQEWQHEVKSDTKAQYQILKKLMHDDRVDAVVCATDAGREGELIFRLTYNMAGCRKPMKRLWISSMLPHSFPAVPVLPDVPRTMIPDSHCLPNNRPYAVWHQELPQCSVPRSASLQLQAPSLFLPVFFIIIVVTVIFTVILACVL